MRHLYRRARARLAARDRPLERSTPFTARRKVPATSSLRALAPQWLQNLQPLESAQTQFISLITLKVTILVILKIK
jgi:hypothetical protein